MSDDQEVRKRIREFILSKFLAGEDSINLSDDTPLVSGGIIDSTNSLKVALFVEKTFSVRLTPEELANPDNLETVSALSKLVTAKMAG
jgi:acyl carrier protein